MIQKEIFEYLQEHDIKPSIQRAAIMDYLLKHRTHPTADEIYQALSAKMPTLSKTTVYNTLKLFADAHAILMLSIDEKKTCFDGESTPHSHFLCRKCGRVYDIPNDKNISFVINPEIQMGHDIEEMQVYYYGTCRTCLEL